MTEPTAGWEEHPDNMFNFGALQPEPVEQVKPNFRASTVEAPAEEKPTLRGMLTGKKQTNARARDTRTPKAQKVVPNKPGQFITPLTDFYNTVAMVVMPFNPNVSMTIMGPAHAPTEEVPEPISVAENCAKAWDEAAQRSERIRNMLDTFLTVGVWGTLVAAHTPIIMAAMPTRFNPAAAMEEMLKRQAEQQND